MKVLDRYILRELIIPIFYSSLSLIFLILIADLFNNLDEFLRFKTQGFIIVRYYLALIPYAFVSTIPWASWLGTLYLLVSFGFHNEMLAMKVSGLKIESIVRPILFLGFLIGLLTFIVNDRVVPHTYRIATELNEVYIERHSTRTEGHVYGNITFHAPDNHLYYFRTLLLKKGRAEDIIVLWLDPSNRRARQKISAKSGTWLGSMWQFEHVTEQRIDSQGRILGEPRTYSKRSYPDLNITPVDLVNASRESVFLTYREMKHATEQFQKTGLNVSSEKVEMQNRLAIPWQGLVMMLISIPLLAPTRTRKGIALYVLVCIGLIFAYQLAGAVFLALGKSGRLFPFLSAWLNTIIFSVGALVYLDKANH